MIKLIPETKPTNNGNEIARIGTLGIHIDYDNPEYDYIYHLFTFSPAGNLFYHGSTIDFQEAILFAGKDYADAYDIDWK